MTARRARNDVSTGQTRKVAPSTFGVRAVMKRKIRDAPDRVRVA
jgi:hypothetical protein